MRKILAFLLAFIMFAGLVMPISTVASRSANAGRLDPVSWEYAKNRALDWIQAASPNPIVGSVGGDWTILALARSGRVTADDPQVQAWLADLDRILTDVERLSQSHDIQNPPSVGTFPAALRRWTDFQRVTIALSALGLDASNLGGHDLTAIFEYTPVTQRHALNQTINGDIYALIALDTMPYYGGRDGFIQVLINTQREDGTWSLNPAMPTSPADISVTAMAIQALALYHNDPTVADAVANAMDWLRAQTFEDPEGISQMIVALTTLGSEFAEEAAYYVNHLLRWFDPVSGGFRRPNPHDPVNHMATEQAAYALTAYWRFVNGMTSLYDMSDAFAETNETTEPSPTPQPNVYGLPGRHADVRRIEVIAQGRTFEDIRNHANRNAIEALASRGIINGRSENAFDPAATMTRAEFAAIITRALGLPARPNAGFTDVSPNAWFAGAVDTAFYYGIVNGVSSTMFNPHGTINRQEAAVMVARAARLTGMDTDLGEVETLNLLAMFGDYRTAARWAWSSLAFCYREGILDDAEFYIQPLIAITRGEIAEMLYRMLGRANLL